MVNVKTSLKNQYLAALCVNIITFNFGAFIVWPSASFLVLQSEESPLETGPMTDDDAGWVSSMSFLGGLPAVIIFAWFAGKWGRRISLILATMPALLGWLIIPFAKNPMQLSVARFLGGSAAGAIYSVIPIYIIEVADTNIRGFLGTFLMFSLNIGILVAYVLGYFFSYTTVAWIMVIPCLIYLCSFLFLPETPQYLLSINKFEKAEKSYCFFHNLRTEVAEFPENFNTELQKLTKAEENLQSTLKTQANSLSWRDFCNPKARKALCIGIFLSTLFTFCGDIAMLNYAATIFEKASSNISPNMSAIVVGVIQLVGSYISTLLVEKSGRKPLLIVSCIGTALGQIIFGIYTQLDAHGFDMKSYSLIPVMSFSFAVLFTSVGIFPLTSLLISELMPPKIRNVGCMICMLSVRLFAFVLIKLFPIFTQYMGLHYTVYMFGIYCLVGVAFTLVFIPETKGKSIEDILASL